ncbi:MAG: transposase [Clostridiales bacterium]|nr:transposase [Clostridiales bacterium]MDD7432460.1 transposase [Clostridiales bacterium]MDY3061894.1 transposase [Eubacteriales bacterium]
MNKQELAQKIWASANQMRSKIEANEYKDYILGFIFYKYLSDKEVRFLKENDYDEELLKSVTEEDPETVKKLGLRSELLDMFNCETLRQARARRDEIIADYSEKAPKAMERLDAGFEEAMTVMLLPKDMRRCTRTSNYLERLNKEVKRRSRVIGIFPNTSSAIRLLGAHLMEENDRWATMRKIYYKAAIQELKERTHLLIDLARQQCLLAEVA